MSRPTRLRVALWTWSRHDRHTSGEVAVDTALDLIDAGGSVNREARSLARTGLTLRARGTFRGLRVAPWRASLPLIAMLTTSAVVALVATDAGGWAQMWSGGASHQPINALTLLGAAAAVILAAASRQPGVTWTMQVLTCLLVGQWWIVAPNLGDTSIASQPNGTGVVSDGVVFIFVPMIGVVGLLLAAGFLSTLAWALLNLRSWFAPQDGPQATRLRLAVAAACLLLPLVAPRLGQRLLEASESLLPWVASRFNGESQALFLMLAVWVLCFAIAVVARRRWPALTIAACATCAALWLPFLLVITPFVWSPAADPVSSSGSDINIAIALWMAATLIGLAVALSLIARGGASAAAVPGSSADANEGVGGPMVAA